MLLYIKLIKEEIVETFTCLLYFRHCALRPIVEFTLKNMLF